MDDQINVPPESTTVSSAEQGEPATVVNLENSNLSRSGEENVPVGNPISLATAALSLMTYQKFLQNMNQKPLDECIEFLDDFEMPKGLVSVSDCDVIDDAHLFQAYHGWDRSHKAGRIELIPNAPCLCTLRPDGVGPDVVQGIRSRASLTGQHVWKISVSFPIESDNSRNAKPRGILIGVVNEEHRMFNYGYNLNQLGSKAWVFDIDDGAILHGKQKFISHSLKRCFESDEKDFVLFLDSEGKSISLVDLNMSSAVRINHLRGKQFHPFVIFRGAGSQTVQIEYLNGLKDYAANVMKNLETQSSAQVKDICGYVPNNIFVGYKKMVAKSNVISWSSCSDGVCLSGTSSVAVLTGHQKAILLSKPGLTDGDHILDLELRNITNFTVSFVPADEDLFVTSESSEFNLKTKGWSWCSSNGKLFYKSNMIGRYPAYFPNFRHRLKDCFYRIFLSLTRNRVSKSSIGFERHILKMADHHGSDGKTVPNKSSANQEIERLYEVNDLGVMFTGLDQKLNILLTIESYDLEAHAKISYVKGPLDRAPLENERISTRTCAVL